MQELEHPHSSHRRCSCGTLAQCPTGAQGWPGTISSLRGLFTTCFPSFPFFFQQGSSEGTERYNSPGRGGSARSHPGQAPASPQAGTTLGWEGRPQSSYPELGVAVKFKAACASKLPASHQQVSPPLLPKILQLLWSPAGAEPGIIQECLAGRYFTHAEERTFPRSSSQVREPHGSPTSPPTPAALPWGFGTARGPFWGVSGAGKVPSLPSPSPFPSPPAEATAKPGHDLGSQLRPWEVPDPEGQAADRKEERKKDLGLLQWELSGARLGACILPGCLGVPDARWGTYAARLCQKGQKRPADSSKDRREQMVLKSAQEERKK